MSSFKNYHMTPEEFRRYGREVVDWIADYYENIESMPVLSRSKPGQIRASLPSHPPSDGEAFESIIKDVTDLILPGVTHWQSPNFFAFFPGNTLGPAILGDLLSSGLGVQGMLWATSPACTELETHVLDWLVEMLGLPEKFLSTHTGGGVIQDSASSATLCALLAARERTTNFDCDCFFVADRNILVQTLSILPEYLRNQATESGAVIDYRDWHIPLGRRFRSLKLWFVIRHYGVEGLQNHVRRHVELARMFADWVKSDERFELAVPPPLNLVCFRHRNGDEINRQLMNRLNKSGDMYLTHTRLQDRITLRFCVGQTSTEQRHVEHAWRRIQEEAEALERDS